MSAPVLTGSALDAVQHRGSHLQIIAAAGSGKTEVVSQRVVSLLADGAPARVMVAFTFTERAAAELRERVAARVEERLGRAALDRLGALFIGTIHGYCFRLLQERVPRYETYEVLDENQLNAFIAREEIQLGVKVLDPKGNDRKFASIDSFLTGLGVLENELIEPDQVPEPFATIYSTYLELLERHRLISFGQQIVRAVRELERPEDRDAVHADLRHLIVDEYQDVNPAQERLIALMTGPQTHLCVVGDDDQAIYQWNTWAMSVISAPCSPRRQRLRTQAIATSTSPVTNTVSGVEPPRRHRRRTAPASPTRAASASPRRAVPSAS